MSTVAAAKRRRAIPQSEPTNAFSPQNQPQAPRPGQPQSAGSPATGLTLPQVIALIDNRLVALERFMNETKTNPVPNTQLLKSSSSTPIQEEEYATSEELAENIMEFDNRFQILATEIGNLKDIVLSLQKYTMDVNKMLLESQMTPPQEESAPVSMSEQTFVLSTDPSEARDEKPASDRQNMQFTIPSSN
jgi:hypothetical protein